MKVAAMKPGERYTANNDDDDKFQGPRNNKRKTGDSVTSGGSGSGEGGTYLILKEGRNVRWTHPQKSGFS